MESAVVVEKSAEELRREIDELTRQQREITERLRDPRGLRRGNFAGATLRPQVRSVGRGLSFRGFPQRGDDFGSEDSQPSSKKRLLSTVVKVEDEQAEKLPEEKVQGEAMKNKDGGETRDEQANDRRPFLLRTSGGRSDSRKGRDGDIPPCEPVPRVLQKERDPSMAKRNRRIFGALLGTLEKFKQEDSQITATEAYLRRSESLKRAEQKAQEENERLRLQEFEQLAEKRRRDLTLRARLASKAEEKQLELLFIQWSDHHHNLCKFLRTKAEPSIFYLPAKNPENIEKLLEAQQQDFVEWKSKRREEITEYQKQIHDEYLANVETDIQRWQTNSNRKRSLDENVVIEGDDNGFDQDSRRLKPRLSREDDVDEEVEDMGDDDLGVNVLEEEGTRNEQDHEEQTKRVVEYASGEE